MKLNFKATIHQRTNEELNRITKDYHFYSATERAIAQNEIIRRESMETDLQKTMARKTDEELMNIAKDMVSYSVEERLVAVEEQQARKKMVMGDKQIEDKKKNDLKPIHYLIIVAVIGAVIFIWNYRPTTYIVEHRLVSLCDLKGEPITNIWTDVFGIQPAEEVTIERAAVQNPATINGVTWAASNVATPGTFAANPEDFGMHFQWNRRKGWSTTDVDAEDWDSSVPTGTAWYGENDPCPQGWHVPDWEDFSLLYEAGSVWATLNGVQGRLFGDAPNQVFLPAAGWRLSDINSTNQGFYWAWGRFEALVISRSVIRDGTLDANASGYSVRCVKAPPPPPPPPAPPFPEILVNILRYYDDDE